MRCVGWLKPQSCEQIRRKPRRSSESQRPDVARRIAKDVRKKVKGKVSTAEIGKLVLEDLRKRKPELERGWLMYERAVKKRTQ